MASWGTPPHELSLQLPELQCYNLAQLLTALRKQRGKTVDIGTRSNIAGQESPLGVMEQAKVTLCVDVKLRVDSEDGAQDCAVADAELRGGDVGNNR